MKEEGQDEREHATELRRGHSAYIIAPKSGAAATSETNVAHELHILSGLECGIDLLRHNGNVRAAEEVETSESGWPSKAVLGEGALGISGFGSNLYVKRGAIGAQRVRRGLQVVLDAHARAFDPEFFHFPRKNCCDHWIHVDMVVAVDPSGRLSPVVIAEPPEKAAIELERNKMKGSLKHLICA